MELKKYNEETELARALYSSPEYIRRVKIMTALWDRMTGRFNSGQSWINAYGKAGGSGFKTWLDDLGDMTENQIARGVKSAKDWPQAYPPTLPQFRKLCLTIRPEEKPNFTDRRIESEKGEIKSLADFAKPRREDGPIAKREKERMRRILAGEDVESKEESMTKLGLHRRWQT